MYVHQRYFEVLDDNAFLRVNYFVIYCFGQMSFVCT